jgi:hypothetical protein
LYLHPNIFTGEGMTKDEALRLALEKLTAASNYIDTLGGVSKGYRMDIERIKAALEAKDEPDKYAMDIECTKCGAKQSGVLTVHTTPPQRKPLTDEEIEDAWASCEVDWDDKVNVITLARAIEAAHGIKGEA